MLVTALAVGCGTPEAARWSFPGEGELSIPAAVPASAQEEEDRILFLTASGLHVAGQRLATTERLPTGEQRDHASVASALATRVELGEREGVLAVTPCTVLGQSASCIAGDFTLDGDRFIRDGVIFSLGDRVVWLDVSGPEARSAEVRDTADRVRTALAWRAS